VTRGRLFCIAVRELRRYSGAMDGLGGKQLVEQLSKSRIYQDYEQAFGGATGLPLSLRPVELWQPAQRNKKHENPFCALMAAHSRTCAACLRAQEELSRDTGRQFNSVTCFAGMCDSAVPVRLGAELIGFLQTGQVRTQEPTRKQFLRVARQVVEWGTKVDLRRLEDAYFHTPVLAPKQYESVLRLLAIFGQHLSSISNQLVIRQRNAEPPAVSRAKLFIDEHQADDLSLSEVANAVNTSTFYFCKLFKKATGLHFTDYLSRVRIEKAKNLLLNPNARVSEVAYDVGFQSLTHFNRVFKRIAGESPSDYRRNFPALR
jgi:AraC-like DNA-binding protein/ligand-binding sensor protein